MPPREPRGLYLKREYFSDFEFQTKLSAEERECYMGLWQLADDSGWLDWQPEQIASHIYRYEGRTGAELLERFSKVLRDTGRLRVLACGHAELPRGGDHSRPGRPGGNSGVLDNHKKHSGKKSRVTLPHHTLPHLTQTSPHPAPGRAPARGAGLRNGTELRPLSDLVGELPFAVGDKKS